MADIIGAKIKAVRPWGMMKKTLAIVAIVLLAAIPMVAAESPPSLKKYLGPAEITKLDWLLLQAQVSSFTNDMRWDDHGLVGSVSL